MDVNYYMVTKPVRHLCLHKVRDGNYAERHWWVIVIIGSAKKGHEDSPFRTPTDTSIVGVHMV